MAVSLWAWYGNVWCCIVWSFVVLCAIGDMVHVVWRGVFGGLPRGHMGVDKAPAERIYTDNCRVKI